MKLLLSKLQFCLLFFAFIVAAMAPQIAKAQEGDDAYDPFSDYSEFDEASDEEADINFFKNGRFLTAGVQIGQRGFTQNLNKIYSSGATYGFQLAYFFDLRWALQFSFMTGDYPFSFLRGPSDTVSGNVALTFFSTQAKYYLNTQNVTKGLANINPYLIGGFSQVNRTYTLSEDLEFSKEGAIGIDAGAGIEIPTMRRRGFLGVQALYHMVNFKDESTDLAFSSGSTYKIKPNGDTFDILLILGLNF